jgi:hypothetical protein
MNINKLYDYKPLDRVTDPNGSRYYVDPEGYKLSSVTTILSATADKSGLDSWRNFVGEKKANQIRDEATGLGTLMHEHLENHMQGIPRPGGSNLVRQMAKRMADTVIDQGLVNVDEIWGIESPLYFPELFAGTADLIGVHAGRPCIMDFKTTNKMKTVDMIGDYFCQLAAYAMAHNHLFDTQIETGVIFMVSRDLKFTEFVITGDDFHKAMEGWAKRVDDFYSSQSSDSTAS